MTVQMTTEQVLDRLDKVFSSEGIIGARLIPILEKERQNEEIAEAKFRGFRWLTDSFFDFYLETIKAAEVCCLSKGLPQQLSCYPSVFLKFVVNFWSFRAGDVLYRNGYPLDGYALLRDLKDQAIAFAAIHAGISSYRALEGVAPEENASETDLEKMRQRRMAEERRVMKLFFGQPSGLSEEVRGHLDGWNSLFHLEVHGSRLTFYSSGGDWLSGRTRLPLVPSPSQDDMVMYVNRGLEIQWMFVRLLPFLQTIPDAFGSAWAGKWTVLDETYRIFIERLSQNNQKPHFQAFIDFIDAKFPNSASISYAEADRKATPSASGCKPSGSAPGVSGLKDIVSVYIQEHRPRIERQLRLFRIQRTLEDAISMAGLATSPTGKRFDHQRRIPREALKVSAETLLKAEARIKGCKTFHDLIELVESEIRPIDGIAALTVYDTAVRIGAKLGLEPDRVYLHAGTKAGAKALGLSVRKKKWLGAKDLPKEFRRLKPGEIEDCLCIFKGQFKTVD